MNMEFYRKLPVPKEIKEQFPITEEGIKTINERRDAINKVFTGESDKFVLVILN